MIIESHTKLGNFISYIFLLLRTCRSALLFVMLFSGSIEIERKKPSSARNTQRQDLNVAAFKFILQKKEETNQKVTHKYIYFTY